MELKGGVKRAATTTQIALCRRSLRPSLSSSSCKRRRRHSSLAPQPQPPLAVMADHQNERAFQKQKGVFLNKKAVGDVRKVKRVRRVNDVGLGFKTPKEVSRRLSRGCD